MLAKGDGSDWQALIERLADLDRQVQDGKIEVAIKLTTDPQIINKIKEGNNHG